MDPKGVTIRASNFSVKETIDRLIRFFEQHGVTIYARIDQQAEAEKAGIKIRALEFILFGNPKVGGPVMRENPIVALDLPLKLIAWEDKEQKVWYAFNNATYLQERYSLSQEMTNSLDLSGIFSKVPGF
jgi:uncharacterized protein (DUF302 family)